MTRRLRSKARKARAGMTIYELAIAAALLIVLSGALTGSLMHMRSLTSEGSVRSKLQDQAEHALSLIVADLQRSGFATVNGDAYPYVFDDGAAAGNFAAHAHPAPTHTAAAGDADFGPDEEIVMLAPAMATDVNGNEAPVLDAKGAITWSPETIDYVVVTGADGVNRLERRVNATDPRILASHVERLSFETNSLAHPTIPIGAVQVQIYFRERDVDGVLHRYSAALSVRLRN